MHFLQRNHHIKIYEKGYKFEIYSKDILIEQYNNGIANNFFTEENYIFNWDEQSNLNPTLQQIKKYITENNLYEEFAHHKIELIRSDESIQYDKIYQNLTKGIVEEIDKELLKQILDIANNAQKI